MTLESLLAHVFWLFAFVMSAVYGWKAIEFFSEPGNTNEASYTKWQRAHQFWFNFVGAFVGWTALWLLSLNFAGCLLGKCPTEARLEIWDALGTLVAFVGVTGHLPSAMAAMIRGISKIFDLASK